MFRFVAKAAGLRTGTGHEAANLCVAVAVVIGPHNGRAETVRLGYNGVVRHDKPLPMNSYTIVSQSTSCTLKPSAKEQHKPFPLARRSNHGLSGEFVKRPSSRAYKPLGTKIAIHTIMTAKLMSLYIVVNTAVKAAVCTLAHKFKYRFGRVATHKSGGHKLT